MQTLKRRVACVAPRHVASRRVVQIQIVNGLRDATRPNRTKFYLSVESEAVHVASEVAP